MSSGNIAAIVDPVDEYKAILESFGIYDALSEKFLGSDFPIGTDEEYMRHYLFGVGRPFINFLGFVDVGVGYDIEVNTEDEDEAIEIKELVDELTDRIHYQTSLIQLSAFKETLGKSAIVLTETSDGSDFFYDYNSGITGVDVINPSTLDPEETKKAFADKDGNTPFVQKFEDEDGNEQEIEIERERVIFLTNNPFTSFGGEGISSFSNCLNELKLAARFPRYKSQLSEKISKLNRHFIVNTDKFGALKQGKEILENKKKSKDYLFNIHQMINEMNERGSDIATMDYIDSKEVSYAGKIPDISGLEKGIFESIAFKMEIPLHTMSYGKDVNRATLRSLSELFVRRRQTGSQLEYVKISNNIFNHFLELKGFEDVTVSFKFRPFLPDDLNEMYNRVASFASRMHGILSVTEIRRLIGRPDKIEYGEADRQLQEELENLLGSQSGEGAFGEPEKPKRRGVSEDTIDKEQREAEKGYDKLSNDEKVLKLINDIKKDIGVNYTHVNGDRRRDI